MKISEQNLLVRYRFIVAFLIKDITLPYPIDIRFQKVSGLNAKIDVQTIQQGGDNNSMYHLPKNITYENLILEGGKMRGNIAFWVQVSNIFADFVFTPVDILITAINFQGIPMSAWVISDAYPIRWSVSDLDANSNDIIIDTLELVYKDLKNITI